MRQSLFHLGAPELIIILIIVFFLFGARRLPRMDDGEVHQSKRLDLRKLGVSFYAVLAVLLALFGFAEFMLYWRWS